MIPGQSPHRTKSGAGASGEGTALRRSEVRQRITIIDAFMICPSGATATDSLEVVELVSELAALLMDRIPMCTGGEGLEQSADGSVQADASVVVNTSVTEEVRTQGTD